jgi:VWFA-related protein
MRTRLCTAAYVCVTVAMLAAQRSTLPGDPADSGSHPDANVVRLDLYAREAGVPVEDLRPEEIELREDGVVQKIEQFDQVKPSTEHGRAFVVFLDTLHTPIETSASMRLPVVRFLDRTIGKDDVVAIVTPELPLKELTFVRKATVLSNIMQSQWDWARRGRATQADPKEQLYDSCYPAPGKPARADETASEMKERRREGMTLDALDDLVTVLASTRTERTQVLTISDGWTQYRENRSLAATSRDASRHPTAEPPDLFGRAPRGRTDVQSVATSSMFAECEADRQALAAMDNRDRLRQLTEHANRAIVSFYTAAAENLLTSDNPAPEPRRPRAVDVSNAATRQDSLRFLADNTDGLAITSPSQVDHAIERITADIGSYYLLAYHSTNTKLDGRFRPIAVKVTRPRVDVRTRRGYRGPTPDQLLSTRSSSPVTTAAGTLKTVVVDSRARLHVRASSWTAPTSSDAGAARMWLVGELDYRTRRELEWSSGARADVTIVAADGREIASKSVEVSSTDGTFILRIPDEGNVIPGEYAVRVRVHPQVDGSLPVTDVARVEIPEKPSEIGEAVLWRRGPSTGPRYSMTADLRFTRTERIRLELPTRTTMAAVAKLLDRSRKPMRLPVHVSERTDDTSDFNWIVVDLALAPLAPGDYAIEVTAGDARQLTTFKVVP